MSEYKNIGIDITENGYIISANTKRFIFDDIKKMREWIEEHISATGDIEQFSEALDDEPKKTFAYSSTATDLASEALMEVWNSIKDTEIGTKNV